MSRAARARIGARLHALVDEKEMVALARGKERGAEREAVDFAFDTQPAASTPDVRNIKGDSNDDPAEVRLHAFESGFE